jgi:hypothetical protein
LVVGSGHQVFRSLFGSLGVWNQLGTDFPNAHVERLTYDSSSNILMAGTLGRGSWSITDPLAGPTPVPTSTATPTPKPSPTPVPPPPTISSIPKIVLVGSSFVISGSHFTAGSMVNFFVATFRGSVNAGPLTPAGKTPTQLTVNVPVKTILGQGFVTVVVVNTDTGYIASNPASALLQGFAPAGIPTITKIDAVPLAATSSDPGYATNNVEGVVVQGRVVSLGGTGFDSTNGVGVNLFCAWTGGKVGPFLLDPGTAGLSSTLISFTLPSTGVNAPPTGPGPSW